MADYRIVFRRDTAANWTSANPILAQGEPALETDTGKLKIGDGTTDWNSLFYYADGKSYTDADVDLHLNTSTATTDQVLSWDGTDYVWSTVTEVNDLTASVTWANVPDANITQTSVTQHEAALSITESQITDLQNYVVTDSAASLASLQFTGGTRTQGTMSWNADEETVDLICDGAVLQLGQELYVHCRNNTGVLIANGTVVMATGTLGVSGRITVAPYDNTADPKYIIGITTEDIADGTDGKAATFGKVRGLDTSSYAEGAVLYTAASGGLTATAPTTGIKNPIAFVISSHATTGTLMVRVNPINELPLDGVFAGNVTVGGTLDVTGAATFTDLNSSTFDIGVGTVTSLTASGAINAGSASITGNLTVDTNTLYVDSTNNRVGVGTASPQYLGHFVDGDVAIVGTDVTNNAEKQSLLFGGASGETAALAAITGYRGSNANFGELIFKTTTTGTPTERMRLDSSGNVGIGITAPDRPLTVLGGSSGGIKVWDDSSSDSLVIATNTTSTYQNTILHGDVGLEFNNNSGTRGYRWSVNGSERMRLDSSGNLLVGTSSAGGFTTSGTFVQIRQTQVVAQSSGQQALSANRVSSDGAVASWYRDAVLVGSISVTSTATAYNTSSDVRLKENIVDAPAGNIDALRVRSFDWKADGSHQEYGFVAQELDAVAPYAVSKGQTEDDMWGVDYSKLVPMLVKEIQDLRARVATLEGN